MPQHIRFARRDLQPTAPNATRQDFADRGGSHRATGGQRAEEQLTMGCLGTRLAQIANQHVGRLIGQGHLEGLPGLGLSDAQRAPLPVEVVERQTDHFATAQPVGSRQVDDGKVTVAQGIGSVDGLEQRLDLISRQSLRQPLASVHAQGVNLQMEGARQQPSRMTPLQESTHRGDHMLQAETIVCPCDLTQKGLDVAGLQVLQVRRATVKLEEFQKRAHLESMTVNRLLSQTARLAQVV
jgi:hypothetical protein